MDKPQRRKAGMDRERGNSVARNVIYAFRVCIGGSRIVPRIMLDMHGDPVVLVGERVTCRNSIFFCCFDSFRKWWKHLGD